VGAALPPAAVCKVKLHQKNHSVVVPWSVSVCAGVFLDVSCRGGAVLTSKQAKERYGGGGEGESMPWSEVSEAELCSVGQNHIYIQFGILG
jgi:hypothetical protein